MMKQFFSIVGIVGLTVFLQHWLPTDMMGLAVLPFLPFIFDALAEAGTAAAAVAPEVAAGAAAATPAVTPALLAAPAIAGAAIPAIANAAPAIGSIGSAFAGPVAPSIANAAVPTLGGSSTSALTGGAGKGLLGAAGNPTDKLSGAINAANTGKGGTAGILGVINKANTASPSLLDMLGKKLLTTAAGTTIGFQAGNNSVSVGPSRERRLRRSLQAIRSGGRGNSFLDELIGAELTPPGNDQSRAFSSPIRGQ